MTFWASRGSDPQGATPLTLEDLDGLVDSSVTTRDDLDAAEHANIQDAAEWLRRRRSRNAADVLNTAFADNLHRRMFGDVWSWAGKHRTQGTNIGVDAYRIVTEMRQMFDDALYWCEHDTFPVAETAVRIHHRLVSIHPYRNGNGRLSRLLADTYVDLRNGEPLTWGDRQLDRISRTRDEYLDALRAADLHDMAPLVRFATGT